MKDKDKKGQNRKRRDAGNASEIGVVRVFSNPGPDAEDRLRRLLSLMVRYATRDGAAQTGSDLDLDRSKGGTTAPEKDSSSQGSPEAEH